MSEKKKKSSAGKGDRRRLLDLRHCTLRDFYNKWETAFKKTKGEAKWQKRVRKDT